MKFLKYIIIVLCIAYKGNASVIVQNGLTQIHDMGMNEKQLGKILLKNIGNKPEKIKVYFNDLNTTCSGNVEYKSPGENPKTLSKFISVNNADFEIGPNEEYELSYAIDLEKNTLSRGSLWVLMMVEIADPISKDVSNKGLEIGSKIRYAIQIISNIGNKENLGLKFSNVHLAKNTDQERVLEASIENVGLFMAVPNIEIQVFDNKGEKVKELKIPSKKVYPQNCQKFTLEMKDLPPGKYKAVLLAEYLEETVGVNINIDL